MKVEIPKDIIKKLEEIKKKHNISIRKQIIEALITHILVMEETDFILENG